MLAASSVRSFSRGLKLKQVGGGVDSENRSAIDYWGPKARRWERRLGDELEMKGLNQNLT